MTLVCTIQCNILSYPVEHSYVGSKYTAAATYDTRHIDVGVGVCVGVGVWVRVCACRCGCIRVSVGVGAGVCV